MRITMKGILGISIATAFGASIITSAIVHNAKKFRKLKEPDKKESGQKK